LLKIEEQEDGWLTVLKKNGLGPAAAILENYGIDSETDLLVLDQDDFSKLASRGLNPCIQRNSSAGVELCVNVAHKHDGFKYAQDRHVHRRP
jgi:hypothetical protein